MKENNVCKYADVCGGCDYQGLSYTKQLELKQEKINDLFPKEKNILPIIPSDPYINYRNKVQVTFGRNEKKNIVVGNYAKDSHYLVPIEECMICDLKIIEIINSIVRLIKKYHISIYDEQVKKGTMRHLLIRSSSLNEYMVIIVTGSPHINYQKEFIRDIKKFNPLVKTIIHNINNQHTSMILGPKSAVRYGKGFIKDELMGYRFKISPSSFYQINHSQAEKLYTNAIKYADLSKDDVVIDAYCGTGTIGIILSKYVKEVIGVEINKDAIKDAIENAQINEVNNISFVCDEAGKYMRKLAKNKKKIDIVIMDPPRSGANEDFLNSLITLKPRKVVYISCNPDTLKRDLTYLQKHNYQIKNIQPVDMFPYTMHIEIVVSLELKNQ